MTAKTYPLTGTVGARVMHPSDAEPLHAAYMLNRNHLAPWGPDRPAAFYTDEGQAEVIGSKLAQHAAGSEVPFILLEDERVVGTLTVSSIMRGPFLSANLGYWVDQEFTGRGIGSAAVAFALDYSRKELGCTGFRRPRSSTMQLPKRSLGRRASRRSGWLPRTC